MTIIDTRTGATREVTSLGKLGKAEVVFDPEREIYDPKVKKVLPKATPARQVIQELLARVQALEQWKAAQEASKVSPPYPR